MNDKQLTKKAGVIAAEIRRVSHAEALIIVRKLLEGRIAAKRQIRTLVSELNDSDGTNAK